MSRDLGMEFEKLLNEYFEVDRITFAAYWNNDVARNSLFYTICILEWNNADTTDRGIIEDFIQSLENGSLDRYEALTYFKQRKGLV